MKLLDEREATAWLAQRGTKVTGKDSDYIGTRNLVFESGVLHCFRVMTKGLNPRALQGLAYSMTTPWDDGPFAGGLLWIRETGIWNEHSEGTAAMTIKLMNIGLTGQPEGSKYSLFDGNELFEMHAYLLVTLIAGWDAYFIPDHRDYFIQTHHHGYLEFVSSSKDEFDKKFAFAEVYGAKIV
jgi:hypothetical protein